MATHGWRSPRTLEQQIVEDYAGFDYYQLVRLSRRMLTRAHPPRTGNVDDQLHIRADLSAGFAGFEVSALTFDQWNNQITLQTPNYCVAGSAAPLPGPFVDWLRSLVADGSRAMADFFDLFNRRIHLLRWRIKSRLHPGLHNSAPDHCDYADYLGALLGLTDPAVMAALKTLRLPRRTLLGLAGLLADGRRSSAALTQSLTLLLGADVTLEPLVGRWLAIDEVELNRLGRRNTRLGRDLVLGRRCFDPQAAVEIRVAPMSYSQVCELLPTGSYHLLLSNLLRWLSERRFDIWMVFSVLTDTAPRIRLSQDAQSAAPRLGYTAVPGRRFGNGATRDIRVLFPAFDPADAAGTAL